MNDWLNKEPVARLLALLTAVVLWFVVVYDEQSTEKARLQSTMVERVVKARLEVKGLGPRLEATGMPGWVDVRVRGSRTAVDKVERSIKAEVAMSGRGEGGHLLRVTTHVPRGIDVLSVEPDSLVVNVERIEDRSMPVRVSVIGTPPDGYDTGIPAAVPDEVTVKGTATRLARIRHLIATVDIDAKLAITTVKVPVIAVDENNKTIDAVAIVPSTVEVTVPMHKAWHVERVDVKPVLQGEPASGYEVKSIRVVPSSVAIVVADEGTGNRQTNQLDTTAIDVSGMNATFQTLARLSPPSGISLVDKEEVSVTVVIGPVKAPVDPGDGAASTEEVSNDE